MFDLEVAMMGIQTEGFSDVCTVSWTDASHTAIEDSSGCPGLSAPGRKTATVRLTRAFRNIPCLKPLSIWGIYLLLKTDIRPFIEKTFWLIAGTTQVLWTTITTMALFYSKASLSLDSHHSFYNFYLYLCFSKCDMSKCEKKAYEINHVLLVIE